MKYSNAQLMQYLPYACDFGASLDNAEMCGFKQDQSDAGDWMSHVGLTPTDATGPRDHLIEEYGLV